MVDVIEIGSSRITPEFTKRFLQRIVETKPNGAPAITSLLVEGWNEVLRDYTVAQLGKAYKELILTAKLFPDISQVVQVMNRHLFGDTEDRFRELCTILDACRLGRQHRTCDEILGRVVEHLGGLDTIARRWKSDEYGVHRKEFDQVWVRCIRRYLEGEYKNSPMPIVGSRLAVPLGSPEESLLALPEPTIAPVSDEKAPLHAEVKKSLSSLIKTLRTRQNGNKEPDVERLPFRRRLYQLAREQGLFEGEEVKLRGYQVPRQLDELEIAMMKHCAKHNENLARFYLCEEGRGFFRSNHRSDPLNYYFTDLQDPLFDVPSASAIALGDVHEILTADKTPEQKEVFYRTVKDKK